ncbi:DUF4402 domain-containing protein [Maribellus maritimus]|uniref:DUF4402 domain-containing protein n=1 Tax=Maribellus maritimus TaxID=2870838 RepID=UPI001EEBB82A|nr:DUF4402 domain-containing protein [Maribellus maritimus]MCG6188898.1 DUF4402 domain-containing protein [Maribellus maritimus]
MKKLVFLFASLFIIVVATQSVKAQESATAESSATIITPISISKNTSAVGGGDLNFGNIAVQSTNGGTVILSTDPEQDREATGGVTLPVSTGIVSPASFTVTGDGERTFSISLPTTSIVLTSGENEMTLGSFESSPSGSSSLSSGTKTVTVGGVLQVNAQQPAGVYTNANGLEVTVNYN